MRLWDYNMIKWSYRQIHLWTYKFIIKDEFGNPIYAESDISSPAMSILLELLSDYQFAIEINKTTKVFNFDELSKEDQMDLKVASIHKLEDIDND